MRNVLIRSRVATEKKKNGGSIDNIFSPKKGVVYIFCAPRVPHTTGPFLFEVHRARMATMTEEKPAGTKVDAGVVAEPFRQQVKNRERLTLTPPSASV